MRPPRAGSAGGRRDPAPPRPLAPEDRGRNVLGGERNPRRLGDVDEGRVGGFLALQETLEPRAPRRWRVGRVAGPATPRSTRREREQHERPPFEQGSPDGDGEDSFWFRHDLVGAVVEFGPCGGVRAARAWRARPHHPPRRSTWTRASPTISAVPRACSTCRGTRHSAGSRPQARRLPDRWLCVRGPARRGRPSARAVVEQVVEQHSIARTKCSSMSGSSSSVFVLRPSWRRSLVAVRAAVDSRKVVFPFTRHGRTVLS